jgi:hypothetical protein
MSENGYLVITVLSSTILFLVILSTVLDLFRTRRQRLYAQLLIERARGIFTKVWESEAAGTDEMHVLRDVVVVAEPIQGHKKTQYSPESRRSSGLQYLDIELSIRGIRIRFSRKQSESSEPDEESNGS